MHAKIIRIKNVGKKKRRKKDENAFFRDESKVNLCYYTLIIDVERRRKYIDCMMIVSNLNKTHEF